MFMFLKVQQQPVEKLALPDKTNEADQLTHQLTHQLRHQLIHLQLLVSVKHDLHSANFSTVVGL